MQQNFTIHKPISEFAPSRPTTATALKTSQTLSSPDQRKNNVPYISPLNTDQRICYEIFKRCADVSVAFLLLATSLPLLALIAVLVKLTSRGPVLYKHRRIGHGGREFECWKFRTMVANADEVFKKNPQMQKDFDEKFKIENDPRVTPLGDKLRRTSLDELPQLIQVLQGKMSLIGPRPIVERELTKYSIYGPKLLSVKPGLSGLWQVSGRSDLSYIERVLLDMKYIDNRSTLLDTVILLKTIRTVLKKSGAY